MANNIVLTGELLWSMAFTGEQLWQDPPPVLAAEQVEVTARQYTGSL